MIQKPINIDIMPLFSLAFRPFFLSGAVFSIVAVLLWASVLNGWLDFKPYAGSFWWHSHEMLFGFVASIVAGFLLTAVQSWTGQPSIKGRSLVALWVVWFAARVMLAIDLGVAKWVVVLVDLAFLPLTAFVLARLVIRVKLWRNLIFVPVIIFMMVANGLMHWGALTDDTSLVSKGSYAMVMLVVLLMTVLGGRVFPMFTANGTGTQKTESIKVLEILTIVSTVLIACLYISGLSLPPVLQAMLLLFAGSCHLIRCVRWRFWITLRVPLVWSLHLGYACIAVGFFMMAMHYLTGQILLSTGLHALTVGAMGTTILSMISRVSLGHTGRKIMVGKVMIFAFIAIAFSFLLRVSYPLLAGTFLEGSYGVIMAVVALCWIVSYGIFSVLFFPKLISKRADAI